MKSGMLFSNKRLSIIIYVCLAIAFLYLIVVPLVGNAIICCDDGRICHLASCGSPWSAIGMFWWFRDFRLTEALSSTLLFDLASPSVINIIITNIAAFTLLIAILYYCGRTRLKMPASVLSLAVLLMILSPATTTSLWQPDTLSQTCSGVLGIFLGCIVFHLFVRGEEEKRLPAGAITIIGLICTAGLLSKETFLGYVFASIFVVTIVGLKSKPARKKCLTISFLLISASALYLVMRYFYGGLGVYMSSHPGGRYSFNIMHIPKNLAILSVGLTSLGPNYLTLNPTSSILLRALAPLSSLLTVLVLIVAFSVARHRKDVVATRDFRILFFFAAYAFAGVLPTIPLSHVSELYLFGPNIGFSFLLAYALVYLLRSKHAESRFRFCFGVFKTASFALLLLLAFFTLFDKGRHFSITWRYSRQAYVAFQPHANRNSVKKKILIYAPNHPSYTYSTYYAPPDGSARVMANYFSCLLGTCIVSVAASSLPHVPPEDAVIVDYSSIPPRPNW